MVANGPKIEQSKIAPKGITPNRTLTNGKAGNELESPLLLSQREHFDPRDIEVALLRLARLLALDIEGRPQDSAAVRGFYLNVLV
ncbi:MAG: hypothetical protein CMM41_07310 [Rhodospirillaceae bacterium]|nr:hypothetical protein [Rhodospirillaceae bacterium]|tara:strand:- start:476 stop:730 length:255 start_codon:yes stop_codon:yes gene_type:complete